MSRYRLPLSYSSLCSTQRAVMSLRQASRFGKIRTTLVLHLISWLNRSRPFVDLIFLRCALGEREVRQG